MKSILRLTAVAIALASTAFVATAAEPGYVDLGKFKGSDACDYVEVNLGAPLLKFASAVAAHQDANAAALIRELKQVRVNVVGYDDSNRADTTERVKTLRRELESQGWVQAVVAREAGKADDVAIYVKTGADDSIQGLVVTVLDGKQAVVVNVVGNIKPDQIATLAKGLNLGPLANLPTVAPAAPHAPAAPATTES